MTFSICVREPYDDDGTTEYRFGVAVTTRLAGVGTLCPFANEAGAVATQSLVNIDLGRKGIAYLEDGLAVDDALEALLNADDGRTDRQLHGVDSETEFAFSGEGCGEWFGHTVGENYTVAGNLLTGPDVIEATADAYEAASEADEPLAFRLAAALAAGHEVGGDKRTDLEIQSAAVVVTDSGRETETTAPYYNNIRVDATETPIADLQATLERARDSHEASMARYEDAYEDDAADE